MEHRVAEEVNSELVKLILVADGYCECGVVVELLPLTILVNHKEVKPKYFFIKRVDTFLTG